MPIKDPTLIDIILSPELRAAMMAAFIALLRIAYDDRESRCKRRALETALCGTLGYGISSGLSYFDLPVGVSVFAGCSIGFLGVDFVRAKARQLVNKRVEKQ